MKTFPALCLSLAITLVSCRGKEHKVNESTNEDFLIAYNVYAPDSSNEDNYEIFIMDMEGSRKKNITNQSDVAWTYLAIKEKILFISDRDTCSRCIYLYEMDANGENVKKITDFKLRDSWMSSPYDGKELIVNPHSDVDSAFYLINQQGEVLQKIYTGLKNSSDPAFSPDGELITFRGGNRKSKREEGYKEEIYIINSDGSGLKQLTKYPDGDTTAPWYAYKAGPPKWHPTENFISYASYQKGKYSLYAVSPDGKNQWKLTDNPQDEVYHTWSPDGRWLTLDVSDNEQTQFDIALMNWETKEMKILTDSTFAYQQSPVFVLSSSQQE